MKRRVDYTLGCDVAEHKKAHRVLKWAEHHAIAQSDDEVVHNQVLFSHVEIKAEADTAEAITQLKTWCAAGFQKQLNLRSDWSHAAPIVLPPQVLWVWVRNEVTLFIALMDMETDQVVFIEENSFYIDPRKPETLRTLLTIMASVAEWGVAEFRPWFLSQLLPDIFD